MGYNVINKLNIGDIDSNFDSGLTQSFDSAATRVSLDLYDKILYNELA